MSYLFETREIGDYRIKVFQDDDAACPCSEFEFFRGLYIWEYSDCHRLHKECNWQELFGEYEDNSHNMEESLKRLVCEYVPQKKIVEYINKNCDNYRMRYDKSKRMWLLENLYDKTWYVRDQFSSYDLNFRDCADELCEILDKDDFTPLLQDCKNIAFYEWQSRGYCQGDCVDGFAYCDKERFSKMCDTNTKNWRQRALELFKDEVKKLGMWMWGDVKYYTLEKKVPYKKVFTEIGREPEDSFDWEVIDSVCGYYMDADDLIDQVIAEHGITDKDAA